MLRTWNNMSSSFYVSAYGEVGVFSLFFKRITSHRSKIIMSDRNNFFKLFMKKLQHAGVWARHQDRRAGDTLKD
jgi:hypothetical protein